MEQLIIPDYLHLYPYGYDSGSESESELEYFEITDDFYGDAHYNGKDYKYKKDGVNYSVQSEYSCYRCGGDVVHIISYGMLNVQVQPKNWSTEEMYLFLRYRNGKYLNRILEEYKDMEKQSRVTEDMMEMDIYYCPSDPEDKKEYKKRVNREYPRIKDYYDECKRFNMELDKKYKEESDERVLREWLIGAFGDYFGCTITYTCEKRDCFESFGWQCNPMIINFVLDNKTEDGEYNFVHHRDINNLYNDDYDEDNEHIIPEDERVDAENYQCYLFEPAESDNYGELSNSDLRVEDFRFSLNAKNYKEVIEGNSDLFVTKMNHYSSHKPNYRGFPWRFYPAICMMCLEYSENSHKLDSETMRCVKGHDPKFYYIDKEVWKEVLKWQRGYDWDFEYRPDYEYPEIVREHWDKEHKVKYEDLLSDYLLMFKYEREISEYMGIINEINFGGVDIREIEEMMLKKIDGRLRWKDYMAVKKKYGI